MGNSVQKWGNSLGLRIPAAIASELQIKKGTPVTLQITDGALMVRVSRKTRRRQSRFKLSELLARVTPENTPPAYNWGPDVGKEIIE